MRPEQPDETYARFVRALFAEHWFAEPSEENIARLWRENISIAEMTVHLDEYEWRVLHLGA